MKKSFPTEPAYISGLNKVKTVYDCTSCLVAVVMSFAFFGMWQFRGVNIGTVITALLNGTVIGLFSKLLDKKFDFYDIFRSKNKGRRENSTERTN